MIAEVIVDISSSSVDKVFDYVVPKDAIVQVGHRVKVPFGSRAVEGFVLGIKQNSNVEQSKLKSIICTLDAQPILTQSMVRLCFFMKKRFFLRMSDVIKLCLPPVVRGKVKQKFDDYVFLNVDQMPTLNANAKKQLDILLFLKEHGESRQCDVAKKFGLAPLKALILKGFVAKKSLQVQRTPKSNFSVAKKNIVLNAQQKAAVEAISTSAYQTFLLHGVTGSGKTEVYINCIKRALEKGKTAIMLVPEISLTPQMFARFKNAFGDTVAILHSSLSAGEKFDEWNRLKSGKAKIAIGARSCIFAPLQNLGVIVVDEEHDSSYFSESNPRYHTHEVAKFLAHHNACPLILGSATPSVESAYLAKKGEYRTIRLTERANKKELPTIEIVDMLSEIRNGNTGIFSQKFLQELDACVKAKKQAMIFLNRRGFSSFLMCRNCGYVPKCQDCDVSLVFHKEDNMLKCHYCNRRYKDQCWSVYSKCCIVWFMS